MVSAAAFSGRRSGAPSKKSGGKKYLGARRGQRDLNFSVARNL
jgi:hypothetical protein